MDQNDLLKFSVVICTYNHASFLPNCIKALLNLNYKDFEIIIVNDGSNDDTSNVLAKISNDKISIVTHTKNMGLSQARNSGIKRARYPLVAFSDDDCLVDKDWLSRLADGFILSNADFVIGQTFYREKDYVGYFPERLVKNIKARWPMGCNICYKKEIFEHIGYFEDLFFYYNNEDSEMAIRAVSSGYKYSRSLEAIVYHQAINWNTQSLLNSAKNGAVWVLLKKRYPNTYLHFGPPVKFGFVINWQDYLYLLFMPIVIIALLIRYWSHGKKGLKIFFTKWPVLIVLRRYYIYKEAIKNRVFMI